MSPHDYGCPVLFPPLLLAAMLLLAGTLSRTGRAGAAALAAASLLWLMVNQRFEGEILLAVTPTNGLTAGDLVGLVGILIAIWSWFDFGRDS